MATRIERLVERQVMLWRMRLAVLARRSHTEESSRAELEAAPPESQALPSREQPPKSGVRHRIPTELSDRKNIAAG